MPQHGRQTVVKLNNVNLSTFTNNTSFGDESDTHETTCYSPTNKRKTYSSGLGDGTITISGQFDNTAAGPRKTIKALKAAGNAVSFVYQPEGAGTGKAQSMVNVIVASYNESAPVADMVTWTSELQMTGELDDTDQA